MKLADRIAQCRVPYAVQDHDSGRVRILNGAAECAELVARSPLRYVLADDLTRLCAELAYSKGARTLACADLLRVPAELLWVEWCCDPWMDCLARYGIRTQPGQSHGRRGALIQASKDGRRGVVRTLWTDATETGALASSAEAYFDLDTVEGEEPQAPDTPGGAAIRVCETTRADDDVLGRCFRFRYERTWSDYYADRVSPTRSEAVVRHVLGTIALDIPILLTFLLLLASRSGLPRYPQGFARLNRTRVRLGKAPLLEHVEVRAPLLPEYGGYSRHGEGSTRRGPRLHHVRGHLMRCGSQVVWRVPHLRGRARSGRVQARTVTWTYEHADRDSAVAALSRLPSLGNGFNR